ncbi:hypothetical protein QYE76_059565 [Lolium multiflorum]|uniref:RNase H type-1 domain-containing protein n=1 Tax=Lolium multiflorum TaxID=4521 RepID=A0AAD8RZK2_LOLMU|nr:hypothetical protein QYE76_059565 [Lolium multiflorum]
MQYLPLYLTPRTGSRTSTLEDAKRLGSRHRRHLPKGDPAGLCPQIHFAASNNVAEYEALIHGLKLAKEGVRRILSFGDSDLVIQQASGDWDAKDANMASHRFHVQPLSGFFDGCEFHHVPRANNEAQTPYPRLAQPRKPFRRRCLGDSQETVHHTVTGLGFHSCRLTGASQQPGALSPKWGSSPTRSASK